MLGARCGAPDDVDAHPPAAPRDEALARAGDPQPAIIRDRMRNARKQANTHRFGPIQSPPRACLAIHRAIYPSLHPYAHMDPRAYARTCARLSIAGCEARRWPIDRAGRRRRVAVARGGDSLALRPRLGPGAHPNRERALAIAPTGNGLSPQPGTGCRARPNWEQLLHSS